MRRRLVRSLAAAAVVWAGWLAANEALAAPTKIRFLDVDSASPMSFVGVYGSGFGDSRGTIMLGALASIDVPLWSDTLIIARVPEDATTGVVAVTPQGGPTVASEDVLRIHTGEVYVVSTAGNDMEQGDESHPFQSLHQALSLLVPGDTVLIREGTYDVRDPEPAQLPALYLRAQQAGTAEKPITWRGFGAEVPIIRGTSPQASASPVVYAGADFVRLARLRLNGENNESTALAIQAKSVWAVGLDIYGFGQNGIAIGEVPDTFIAANLVHEGGTRRNLDHGIWMTGEGGKIRDNIVSDLPNGYGILLQYQTQSTTQVFSNVVRNVAGGGIGLSRVKGGNHVYNNIVWNAGISQGCRCALEVAYGELGGEPSAGDHVYFNTFLGPGFSGLYMADRAGALALHSNIFAKFRVGIRIDDAPSTSALSSSRNLWHGADEPPQFKWAGPWLDFTQFQNESGQEKSSLLTDPKLADLASGDAHLVAGSPAINVAGGPNVPDDDFEGNARPSGSAPDIGAYEYQGASGGSAGAGGETGSAGTSGAAGQAGGTAGSAGDAGGGWSVPETPTGDEDEGGGCGCSVPGGDGSTGAVLVLALAIAGATRRRKTG